MVVDGCTWQVWCCASERPSRRFATDMQDLVCNHEGSRSSVSATACSVQSFDLHVAQVQSREFRVYILQGYRLLCNVIHPWLLLQAHIQSQT